MDIQVGGLFGLIILIADIWTIKKTIESRTSIGTKVIWVVVILVLPVYTLVAIRSRATSTQSC